MNVVRAAVVFLLDHGCELLPVVFLQIMCNVDQQFTAAVKPSLLKKKKKAKHKRIKLCSLNIDLSFFCALHAGCVQQCVDEP